MVSLTVTRASILALAVGGLPPRRITMFIAASITAPIVLASLTATGVLDRSILSKSFLNAFHALLLTVKWEFAHHDQVQLFDLLIFLFARQAVQTLIVKNELAYFLADFPLLFLILLVDFVDVVLVQ
jgi:hypothetical protein